MKYLQKLTSICNSWGGDIVITANHKEFRELAGSEAPFASYDIGINWTKKLVILNKEDLAETDPVDLVHEMGHIFASKKPVSKQKEYDFLGWEYLLSRQIGITRKDWRSTMADYYLDPYELCHLNTKEFTLLMKERIQAGVQSGLIVKGKPVAVR